MTKSVVIRFCAECPFFFSDEYDYCCAAKKEVEFGSCTRSGKFNVLIPIPEWCPLRQDGISVEMETDPDVYREAAEELSKLPDYYWQWSDEDKEKWSR